MLSVRVSTSVKRPKELVVQIGLPGVRSVKDVDLEVFDKKLELEVNQPRFVLKVSNFIEGLVGWAGGVCKRVSFMFILKQIDLPYVVNTDESKAEFDNKKELLTVTLKVLQEKRSKHTPVSYTHLTLPDE